MIFDIIYIIFHTTILLPHLPRVYINGKPFLNFFFDFFMYYLRKLIDMIIDIVYGIMIDMSNACLNIYFIILIAILLLAISFFNKNDDIRLHYIIDCMQRFGIYLSYSLNLMYHSVEPTLLSTLMPYYNILSVHEYVSHFDGVTICLIVLTEFLFIWATLISWESIKVDIRQFVLLLFFLEIVMLLLFTVKNLILFYILFEATLAPMFIFIGKWGSTKRRIYASFKLAGYTLFGSILMFSTLLWIYATTGLINYDDLMFYDLDLIAQILLFAGFFSAFAIKIPMFPLHLWLPEAHVEAPTGISVLLAGVLLKTGGYGFYRFAIPICYEAVTLLKPWLIVISIFGVLYGSLIALCQVDMKKMIAYASVSHMNIVALGLFSLTEQGTTGAIYLMLSHGITSSGLFMCIGVLYDRYHTRILRYYSGSASIMPLFSIIFFLLMLGNISFPGTGGFVSEVYIFYSYYNDSMITFFFLLLNIIFGAFYTFWLGTCILFGSVDKGYIRFFNDLNCREFVILVIFIAIMLLMGISSTRLIYFLNMSPIVL